MAGPSAAAAPPRTADVALLAAFWLLVAAPLVWGLFVTLRQAWALVG
jgi:hypothetical protein